MSRKKYLLIGTFLSLVILIIFIIYYSINQSKLKEVSSNESIADKLTTNNVRNSNDEYMTTEVSNQNYMYITNEVKRKDIITQNSIGVNLEVVENSITDTNLTIIITDNSDKKYGWGASFRIQKLTDNVWEDLNPIRDLTFVAIGYNLDENNQIAQDIDFSKYYGKLGAGRYRLVKSVYDNEEYIDFYSNDFEIKT